MTRPAARPPIHLLDSEADRLSDLAMSIEDRQPEVSALLLSEIERAKIHRPGKLPAGIVTMLSTVEFVDEGSDTRRTLKLVFPPDADIEAGRISILTLVGAGLIGLAEDQSILWPDREHHERRLRIVRVTRDGELP